MQFVTYQFLIRCSIHDWSYEKVLNIPYSYNQRDMPHSAYLVHELLGSTFTK